MENERYGQLSDSLSEEAKQLSRRASGAQKRQELKSAAESAAGITSIGSHLEGALAERFQGEAETKENELESQVEFERKLRDITKIMEGVDSYHGDKGKHNFEMLKQHEAFLDEALESRGEFIFLQTLREVNRIARSTRFNSAELERKRQPPEPLDAEISAFTSSLIFRHKDKLDGLIKSAQPRMGKECLISILNLVEDGDEPQRQAGLEIIQKHSDLIQVKLMEGKDLDLASRVMEKFLTVGNEAQINAAKEIIENLLATYKSGIGVKGLNFLLGNLANQRSKTYDLGLEYTKLIVHDQYGLEPKDIVEVWHYNGGALQYAVQHNLDRMYEIESKRPGIVKFLNNEYGIDNYERYPEELLIQQYEQHGNKELPYGAVIYPKYDHNGAFSNDLHVFRQLGEQLKDKYLIRIVECGSKQDVARALIKFNRNYNPQGDEKDKLAFMLIGGHGSPSVITLGTSLPPWTGRNEIRREDLMGRGIQRTSEFLRKDATIILASCSTGANEGIGQKLSKTFGMRVIAPSLPASLESIKVKLEGDKLDFKVSYSKDNIERTYVAGVPENNLT